MPAVFNYPRQMPLTPPEYYDQYSYAGKPQPSVMYPSYDQYKYGSSGFVNDAYYGAARLDGRSRYEESWMRQHAAAMPLARETDFGPIAAPILPPIRAPEQQTTASQTYKREAQTQVAKKEKTSGGVAAELDYDMDTMVDFVAQMTSGMWVPFVARHDLSDVDFFHAIQPSTVTVEKKFRQYVQSVLTSTRLPSATLLLALHYLSDRIKRRSARADFPHRNSNNLYHLLTVALMLASKFLDDNTFQNRSWAEVSQLPVSELNAREIDWLHDIRWHLHVDWEDAKGVRAWFAKWDEYTNLGATPADLNLDQLKLNPIDVTLRNMLPSAPVSPPARDFGAFGAPAHFERFRLPGPAEIQWPQIRSLSPPSAGPTNASTPEYYNSGNATPAYVPSQHQAYPDYPRPSHDGQLVYTRHSPLYGPGYVCETRQRGTYTYDTHSFVGFDYTKQYAAQLEVGWCEMHRRYNCFACGGNGAMFNQTTVA